MASFSLDTFLVPLRPTDVNVRIRNCSLVIMHNITACSEVSMNVKDNVLIIKMKADSKTINLDFKCEADARSAMIKLKDALETACSTARDRGIVAPGPGGTGGGGGGGADLFIKDFDVNINNQTEFIFLPGDDVLSVYAVYVNGVLYEDWTYSNFTLTLTILPTLYALDVNDQIRVSYYKTS